MRYVGAVLLGLVAVGFFPFNLDVLSTMPGLFFAGLSALAGFFALRLAAPGLFGGLSRGAALVGLANAFEEIEQTRHTHFIGAGGGVDSLPKRRQSELEEKVPAWMASLRKQSPHDVTKDLLQNMHIAKGLGRLLRVEAQAKLLDALVREGIALNPDHLFADRPGIPSSRQSEALANRPGIPSPRQAQATLSSNDPAEALPTLPDVSKLKPIGSAWVGNHCIMFYENPPLLAIALGIDTPLRYLYSASVYDHTTQKTSEVYTLETGTSHKIYLCRFDRNGMHYNICEGDHLTGFPLFEVAVTHLVCSATGIPPEAVQRIEV